jgi:hypothetical protein
MRWVTANPSIRCLEMSEELVLDVIDEALLGIGLVGCLPTESALVGDPTVHRLVRGDRFVLKEQ